MESAIDYAILTADFQDRITGWNSGATRLLGWEEADMLGRPCKLIFTSEDCVAGVPEAEMMKALNEGTEVVTPLQHGDGEPHSFLKILHDRTEQKREEEQRQPLLAKLNHRAKNTLAIVQSLVSQAVRRATNPEALREALDGRLDCPLAIAHDLLTREAWRGARLADAVQATLAPYDATEQVRVRGPELHLTPNAALMLNVALNELATNAAEYGALSMPHGYVEVIRSLHPADTGRGGYARSTMVRAWRPVARRYDTARVRLPADRGWRVLPVGQRGGAALPAKGVECCFQIPVALRSGGT